MCRFLFASVALCLALLTGSVTAQTPQQGSAAALSLAAVIDGHTYLLSVANVSRRPTMAHEHQSQLRGQHVQGHVEGVPDSWVRLSRIGGQWQGVISVHGALHRVQEGGPGSQNPNTALQTEPVTPSEHPADCASDHLLPVPAELSQSGDPDEETSPSPRAQLLTSSAICNNPVDGLCLMARLVTVFDSQFQQQFPDTFQDQAVALLNVMEGYYLNDVRVGFTDLHIEFPQTELFSTTRNTIDFLEAVTEEYDELSFMDTSQQSPLLHVVTGRNFRGSAVGAAWLGGACSRNGFATGVTQLLDKSVTTTALIAAHEIGHNFGAVHDVNNNSCDSGFIMAAELNTGVTQFSSCSRDEIADHVSKTINSDRCYDFPVDVRLIADDGNPDSISNDTGEQVTLLFDLLYQHALRGADGLRIKGQLDDAGELDNVQMDGGSCQLGSDNKSFQCYQSSPASALVTITLSATGHDSLQLNTQVILDGDNVIDVSPEASQLLTTLTVDLASIQPNDLVASSQPDVSEVTLTWIDRNNGEVPYRVERRQGSAAWQQLMTLSGGAEQYLDSSVELDVDYRYRVVAIGDNGSAEHSNVVSVRIESTPTPPVDVAVVADQGDALLTWQNTAGFAVAIQVECRRLADSGSWTQWLVVTDSLDPQTEQFVDVTPLEGLTYEYRLRALNITVHSAPSEAVAVEFSASEPEPEPKPEPELDEPAQQEPDPAHPDEETDANGSDDADDNNRFLPPADEDNDNGPDENSNDSQSTVSDDNGRSGGAAAGLLVLAMLLTRRRLSPHQRT